MRAVHLFVVGLLLGACAQRSEAELQAEFDEFVRARNACEDVSECVRVELRCPLPCAVAVNVEHAQAIRERAEELIEEYESDGRGCAHRCPTPSPIECREARCFPEP